MRRNIRSHTYCDTAGTVYEQIRYPRRHYSWLRQCVVEVIGHIDGLLVDVLHHCFAKWLQACFGVTHSSGGVSVHTTKVTLSVNQSITHRPILRHSDQCAINRRISVGMILTQHLAYYTRGFFIWFVMCISQTHHSVKYTAMYRFESISHVRKGARYNHRHAIVDVRAPHLFLNIYFYYSVLV